MEEDIKRLTDKVEQMIKDQPDNAKEIKELKGQIGEIREQSETDALAVNEIKQLVEAIEEKSLDRDQVLEILETFKEDNNEPEEREFVIKDQTTEWAVVSSKEYNNSTETEYAFEMDVRFSPQSRYVKTGVNTQVPSEGGGTAPGIPINELRAGNPWDGQVQEVSVGQNGVFQLIDMTTMSFSNEATHGGNTNRTLAGGASDRSINVKNFVLETMVNDASMEDVPAYRMAIEEAIMMADAQAKGAEIFDVLQASITGSGGISEVKSGVAATLPTAANMPGKLLDIKKAVRAPYRVGARWHISRDAESVINKGANTNSVFHFDPALGLNTMWGYPVIVNDHCEDGDTSDDVSVIFGNFRRGAGIGMRTVVEVKLYEQTRPGAITFFARSRFAAAVNDTRALAGMSTGT